MPEKSPEQRRVMIEASTSFERSWIIISNPADYPIAAVTEAFRFLTEQIGNFSAIMRLEKDGVDPMFSHKDLELVLQGLYHHNYQIPFRPEEN